MGRLGRKHVAFRGSSLCASHKLWMVGSDDGAPGLLDETGQRIKVLLKL